MTIKNAIRNLLLLVFLTGAPYCLAQNVPLGIFYQAVARDSYGKELANRNIDVKFSIIKGNPLGTVVYEELHSKVPTSKYGVFSIIIGKGTPTGGGTYGELSQVDWGSAYHYLKIEVKFDNDFMDMGTMQFLAVPYALYAQKSLEPGPQGPKGDPGPKGDAGDPASDKQTISFDQSNLTISGGNSVPLTSLLQNLTITKSPEGNYLGISRGNSVLLSTAEADGDPTNEIQDLTINADKLKITKNPQASEWDLSRYLDNTDNQALIWDPVTKVLSISGSTNTVNLSEFKNNELQDLVINSDVLKITNNSNATSWSLAKYLQSLTWNPVTRKLGISDNAATIDLSELKNDADADPTNELQNLTYTESTNTLKISGGNSVVLGTMVAYRAKKDVASYAPMPLSNVDFIPDAVEYNDGNGLNIGTGEFTADYTGLYTFEIKYIAPSTGNGRNIMLFKNGNLYDYLESNISVNTTLLRTITIKLLATDKIKFVIHTGTGTEIGTGIISGYRMQ